MSWNITVFMLLNASQHPGWAALRAAQLAAMSPLLLIPVLLTSLWIWGQPDRRPALLTSACAALLGQAINWSLGQVWYEPRPFMSSIGHTWIVHIADNGFPSDHATLAWTVGLSLILTRAAKISGIVTCSCALLTGVARVYLGVHFPIDVIVSMPVGLAAASIARVGLPAASRIAMPIEYLYETIIMRLPNWFPFPRNDRSGLKDRYRL